ncbi:hypothetical protein EBO15_42800 [Actinomadura harenae]|uniref:Uncharacterized protein n=1 Tax=Actinomadura harenae TaxID=2483351 RepID=A0A3M2L5C3_9ACTN|nr:hypothetical protein EBO15_42800 [Actinomadura harenae]
MSRALLRTSAGRPIEATHVRTRTTAQRRSRRTLVFTRALRLVRVHVRRLFQPMRALRRGRARIGGTVVVARIRAGLALVHIRALRRGRVQAGARASSLTGGLHGRARCLLPLR